MSPGAEVPAAPSATHVPVPIGGLVAPAPTDPQTVQRVARDGVTSHGRSLPHGAAISRSFGPEHDVSNVTAHIGGAAGRAVEAIGAQAYAVGGRIAFRVAPDLRLAAHEAAHVVQQRGGVQLPGGVGADGDRYERNAESVADRVAAGASAADLLTPLRGPQRSAVQCYRPYSAEEQRPNVWRAGKPVRVSEDGRLAVGQDGGYGSHDLWAEASMIGPADHVLQTTGSRYRLTAGQDQLVGPAPNSGQLRTLTRVVPIYGPTWESGSDMTMPDDCGVAAHEVTGAMDDQDKKTEMVAVIKDLQSGLNQVVTGCDDVPMKMKRQFLEPFLRAKSDEVVGTYFGLFEGHRRDLLDTKRLAALDRPLRLFRHALRDNDLMLTDLAVLTTEGEALRKMDPDDPDYGPRMRAYDDNKHSLMVRAEQIKKVVDATRAVQVTNLKLIDDLLVAAYNKLDTQERSDFERRIGINRYANPSPGQAYAISTGGPSLDKELPGGEVQITYNVHWAGVVMASGPDTVTMENSAQHKVLPRNKNWIFQMYGQASDDYRRRGQTFHEQNRDVVGAHGTSPTTMVVKPR